MKNTILSVIFFLMGIVMVQAQSDAVNNFFEKYKEDPSFKVVNISSSMFAMISGMDIESLDPEMKELLENITGMKILTKPSEGLPYFKEAMTAVQSNKLEELMSFKEEESEVFFYGKNNGGKNLSEVIMLTMEKNNFVLMQIKGNISLSQLSKLSSIFNR